MESLLEGLEENRLDALYLFITDVLRDATAFRRFFANLMSVLPQNYSVHRIEAGHEFLKQMRHNNNDSEEDQRLLFRTLCGLESLRTLIVSDGYVQRKDQGAINTRIFLQELPAAASLVNLDVHRMELKSMQEVELLASACESISESLEDLRLTGLFLKGQEDDDNEDTTKPDSATTLDPVVNVLLDFQHLRSLTLALYPVDLAVAAVVELVEQEEQQQQGVQAAAAPQPPALRRQRSQRQQRPPVVSPQLWYELCQLSTLQDLTLRHMRLDDEACRYMSQALQESNFLSSLDLRQNPGITEIGYGSHLSRALELNFSSWCTVSVDDAYYQAVFHVLIELNHHNRGDVVRNLNRDNLAQFLADLQQTAPGSTLADRNNNNNNNDPPPSQMQQNPTAVFYFLRIHDSVRNPLAALLEFKAKREKASAAAAALLTEGDRKRKADQL